MRQVINDCMNLAVTGINNAHFFLALVKITKANSGVSPEAQREAQKTQQAFVPSQLDISLISLRRTTASCELEDSVISLGFIMQALMQQGGVLKEPQVDKNGELVLELKAAKVFSRDATAEMPKVKLVDQHSIQRGRHADLH